MSGTSMSSSGTGTTISPNQRHDAVLRTFASLLSSAVATADDTKSLEQHDNDATNTTCRDLCAARSAGLPLLFSSEVLAAAHAQLRVAQAAAAARKKDSNSGLHIRNVVGGGSENDDGDDDSSIWWLASAPSLDLRNKSKPLSSLLSRSLRMSPAVSAAFNLSLPVRAVCGRAEDLVNGGGEAACGSDRTSTSTTVQAGSVLTNKTSLTILPRRLLQNVAASYKSLVDSRLRSSLSALLKRTLSSSSGGIGGIGVHSTAAAALLRSQTVGLVSLMSQSDAVVVTAAASSFRVVDVPGGSTDEGLDSTGHLHGRTVPLIFEVVLDVIVHEVKTTAILQAPGSLTGQFVARRSQGKQEQEGNQQEEKEEEEPRLARVELTVDAPHLLQMMMEEARKAVREAVSACAANITAPTAATTNIAGQEQQQQYQQPAQPQQQQQQQQNLPRKVSDTLLRPGLKRKAPTSSSSAPSLTTSKRKSILPKPKRRSSAFSSTGSITDEEGSATSCSGQQLSEGSDTFMPPPRPRSPLSKSRSSSRLLFYSGGRKSSAQDGFSATSATAISGAALPGRIATSKSANQNASWEEASYSSSASGSCSSSTGSSGSGSANATNINGAAGAAAAPSSANASAATAAGFALLSMKKTSPKAKTSSQGKTGTELSSGGIKRARSDQNMPFKKRIVSRDG